ncbi:hypothetical protein GQ55_2G276400 [Panicum hallii var. hallii]|uniref:Peptidase A1 domain-containing protein n=1 Tax=Panicum hallii var. hallii TaxID=1504633 RepID=A0A2T7ESZ8_9POAL|nr:hypothetical protein GQ55_2G276400 [Panicum hallii var. hallii]
MGQGSVALVLLVASAAACASPAASMFAGDVRVALRHVDAGKQLSRPELIRRAAQRSKARAAALSAVRGRGGGGARFSGASEQQQQAPRGTPVRPSGDLEYVVDLAIGTPPQHVSALLDTGSDLIWTQCAPCTSCLAQPDPVFAPAQSASYEPMRCAGPLCADILHHGCLRPDTCTYRYNYGDGTTTMGVYATERFTFTSSSGDMLNVPLGFGCGSMNVGSLNNGSGIVGFGRNPLSLVSQLNIRRFSYCLTPYASGRRSTLLFGSLADGVYGDATGPVQTTPLLQSPQNPTFYYVHLTGLTVGARRLRIPESAFALQPDGSGGVIVDSGTALTLLPGAVLAEVVRAFRVQLRLPFANGSSPDDGVCFMVPEAWRRASSTTSQVPVPRMVFHFQGADLDLPRRNYVLDDHRRSRLCLLLADSGDDGSTIGNLLQQDMRVLYDLQAETLSFAPAQC